MAPDGDDASAGHREADLDAWIRRGPNHAPAPQGYQDVGGYDGPTGYHQQGYGGSPQVGAPVPSDSPPPAPAWAPVDAPSYTQPVLLTHANAQKAANAAKNVAVAALVIAVVALLLAAAALGIAL
jgi:hypothetical protein